MSLSLTTWNVNGIRASLRKGLKEKISQNNWDIICLQELKCQDEDMSKIFSDDDSSLANIFLSDNKVFNEDKNQSESLIRNYKAYWHTAKNRKGYSGTAILIKKTLIENSTIQILDFITSLNLHEFDIEGRITALKLKIDDKIIYLLNGYYPQGGREGRVDYKIRFYREIYNLCAKWIQEGFDVLLCGDLNSTLKDTDLARPTQNRKTTGCLPQERVAFNWLLDDKFFESEQLKIKDKDFEYLEINPLESLNFYDLYRHYYPSLADQYTYWDQITKARDRNVGWRIDYWIASKNLLSKITDIEIQSEILGSDHCPVTLYYL